MEKRTINQWCMKLGIGLLETKYYEDTTLYSIDEFEQMIPRNIQIPLSNETSLDSVARDLVPKDFAKKYKQMKKMQEEINATEDIIKQKLLEMFESIPGLETNTVTVDGLSFTYVGPSKRKVVDTKKLQEEHPDIYKKCQKESNVKSSIRTKIEY